jgi:hypothetical protein
MHDYLRAIGFSRIRSRREMQRLLNMVMGSPEQDFASGSAGAAYGEKSRDFIRNAGLTVRGEIDEHGTFLYEYYFPHYNGRVVSLTEDLSLEKLSEREDYNGLCDVTGLGVSLIFHMNHMTDYSDGPEPATYMRHVPVNLSALSISGKVLLPLARSEAQINRRRRETAARNGMIAATREGDQEAMENLTLEDMDLYSTISRRLRHEDILTIVESTFMPYGLACDQYSILGDIIECEEVFNQMTGERLYQMLVQVGELIIDLCMNAEDLLGEPQAGRRFKGVIWLQGHLDY